MAKAKRPKLIPLTELRALCKEAGVTMKRWWSASIYWAICRNGYCVMDAALSYSKKAERIRARQDVKAYCEGRIAMRERGEL